MNRYQFKIDPPEITEELSGRHKNFDKLYEAYQVNVKPPTPKFWKGKFILSATTTIVLVCSILLWPSSEEEALQVTPLIDPPMEALNVPFTKYQVDANAGDQLNYLTGTAINVPANVFTNVQGEPITGTVDVVYREWHNPTEFFVSGIPMTIDKGNDQYHFNSAGMLEIRATQNGDPLILKKGEKIEVNLASAHAGDQFDLYFLDENSGTWVNKGKDSNQPVPQRQNTLSVDSIKHVLAAEYPKPQSQLPPEPILPRKLDKTAYLFDLDILDSEFPELANFKNVVFEIAPGQGFDPALYDVLWEDIRLKRAGKEYQITLEDEAQKHTFKVFPALKEAAYQQALAAYQKQKGAYDEAMATFNTLLSDWQSTIDQKARAIIAAQSPSISANNKFQPKVIRKIGIEQLGVWNCDSPEKLPEGAQTHASFFGPQNEALELEKVYLIDGNRNILFRYNKSEFNRFQYDPRSRNMIWTVLPDSRLAIFRPEDFDQVDPQEKEQAFTFSILDQPMKSLDELKAILTLNPIEDVTPENIPERG